MKKSIHCKIETFTKIDVIYLRRIIVLFFFVKIYYGELLKLKDKRMKTLNMKCKYIHIYTFTEVFF